MPEPRLLPTMPISLPFLSSRFPVFPRRLTACAILALLGVAFIQPLAIAENELISSNAVNNTTGNHFGDNWTARPLQDTTQPVVPAVPKKPQIDPAASEARLAPYEGFIKAMEKSLSMIVPPGSSRVSRLNAVQHIVFDEQTYKGDAGELIGRLEKVFPKEAAQTIHLAPTAIATQSQPHSGPQIVSSQPMTQMSPQNLRTRPQPTLTHREMAKLQKAQAKAQKDADDDFFGGDPFFKDDVNTAAASAAPTGGMKAKAVMAALAGVGMAAGGVAGSYYLNKGAKAPTYAYPNNGYGYGAYPQQVVNGVPYATNGAVYGYPNNGVINNGVVNGLPAAYGGYPVVNGYPQAYAGYPQSYGAYYPQQNTTGSLINTMANRFLGGGGMTQGYYGYPSTTSTQAFTQNGIQSYNSNGTTYYNSPY